MLLQVLHGLKWRALIRSIIISQDSLVPRPLPLRRGLVLTICTCANNYSIILYINQEYRTYFEMDSSGNLTCRILLEYYFSGDAVSLFQNLHSNRKVTNRFVKKASW